MNTNIIQEACANIASISQRLERHAKVALQIIDDLRTDQLGEEYESYLDDHIVIINDMVEGDGCCSGCMNCLGLSWKDFF